MTTMGFMDRVKGMMSQHGDKLGRGVEKAGEAADARTKGKHRRHIRTGTGKAREAMDRMARERRDKGDRGGSTS